MKPYDKKVSFFPIEIQCKRRLVAGIPFFYIDERVYKKFLIKQEKAQKVFNNLIVDKAL